MRGILGAMVDGVLSGGTGEMVMDEDAWEAWYAAREVEWSGRPNSQLVAEVGALAPGRALDVGCGEGADALWLAERGWQVLAVDFSATALRRGKAQAVGLGRAVAARVMWMRADVMTWSGLDAPPASTPAPAPAPAARRVSRFETRFDLVSAQFLHLAADRRRAMVARLCGVVAPGGSLLVVGHDPADLALGVPRPGAGMLCEARELAGLLDPAGWEVLVAQARPRPVAVSGGGELVVRDAVLHARRRAS
ncbi:Methyltransferase domain-containing protein [Frankia sp. EI5c]|nr:Methyltransferase domain-containing protein [Frankia sp. EI5c]